MQPPPVLSADEVMSFLQCKRKRLAKLIADGTLVPLAFGRPHKFLAADVYRLIENRQAICRPRKRKVAQ